jgi:phosphate transport system protein
MRTAYHQQLDELIKGIAESCGLTGEAMERATQALLQVDLSLAEEVIADHYEFTLRAAKGRETVISLLARQAPVASELRVVVSSLKNIADVERMAALALHVAKITRRKHPSKVLPEEVNGYFTEMGRIAVDIGNSVKDVLLSGDPDTAQRLSLDDDDMDHLHRHLFTVLLDREWKHGVESAVNVTLLGRYYERFADHAVEIGRRVVYQSTGQRPPHTP